MRKLPSFLTFEENEEQHIMRNYGCLENSLEINKNKDGNDNTRVIIIIMIIIIMGINELV